MRHWLKRAWRTFENLVLLALIILVVRQEGPPPGVSETQINQLVAGETFDYLGWELGAIYAKGAQMSFPIPNYLPTPEHKELVLRYFQLLGQAEEQARQIEDIYGNPDTTDPAAASASRRAEHERLRDELDKLQPAIESILQNQVSTILVEQGFAIGGQTIPPVQFRFTPLPYQLIISPRDEIRRMYEFSLEAGLDTDRAKTLEDEIDHNFDVSSLVVPIGGIGLYPTMLLESASLEWTVGVVAHEWTHNWLTLFPMGWNYDASAELRTMNETAASIVENEVRAMVIQRFYPEISNSQSKISNSTSITNAQTPNEPEKFDFQKEMHTTRVEVDRLLKEGQSTEAEAYMEARRQIFWEQGYRIRKLNQAYFAFYGAYAEEPGASGQDPVGPAVVKLRQQSPSLKAFLLKLAPMTSFDDLLGALNQE